MKRPYVIVVDKVFYEEWLSELPFGAGVYVRETRAWVALLVSHDEMKDIYEQARLVADWHWDANVMTAAQRELRSRHIPIHADLFGRSARGLDHRARRVCLN